VIAVVLMRGDVLRGVFCAAGKRSAFGSARRNAANPRVGSRRQRLRPARKEIRRGGEKPRGRSVIRCMAAPDRRRCLQRWRSSGNRGSARLRPSRRGLQWSVGASRQAGGWSTEGWFRPHTARCGTGENPRRGRSAPRSRGRLARARREGTGGEPEAKRVAVGGPPQGGTSTAERSGRPRGPVGSGRGTNPGITGKVEEGAGKGQRARYEALRG
jgi:hypothetical protein